MFSDYFKNQIKNQLFQIKTQEENINHLAQNLTNQINELKTQINTLEQTLNSSLKQERPIEIIPEEQLIINQKPNINNIPTKTIEQNQNAIIKEKNQENSWEMNLGTNWLGRIGIVAVLIGLTLALQHSFVFFSKELKLITGIILAIILFFSGKKLFANYNRFIDEVNKK